MRNLEQSPASDGAGSQMRPAQSGTPKQDRA
jgi:hypothetical protein